MDSFDQLFDRLFGKHPYILYAFGERDAETKLADTVEASASNPFEGLSRHETIEAAIGLYPILIVTWDFLAEREYTGREVIDLCMDAPKEGCTTFHTFATLRGIQNFHERMVGIVTQRSRSPKEIVRRLLMTSVGRRYMPIRKGERLVTVHVATTPLPGATA